ncbi:MAG: hypothetical protein NVS2B14_03310 [Chamaesiphon sp.]
MNEDSMLFSLSPFAYAEYLEHLSNDEFWNHAYEKAHMYHSVQSSQTLTTVAAPPDNNNTLTCIICSLRNGRCVLPLASIREMLPPSQQLTLLPQVRCLRESQPLSGLVSFQLTDQSHPKLVKFLETQGLLVRTIRDPDCVRACVHYFTLPSEIDQLIEAIEKFCHELKAV